MKNKLIIGSTVVLVISLCAILTVKNYNDNYGKKFFKDKEVVLSIGNIIKQQEEVDKNINNYLKAGYTIDEPKILNNPYQLSPLTSLIIFTTEKEIEIKVSINGKYVTTMEKSKEHLIPIYGLKDDFENEIELSYDDKVYNYTITTDKFEGNKLEIEKTSDKLDESLYLLSPNFTSNRIYDKNGTLLWYIDGDYAGDIEYIDNNKFYISDSNQGVNGVKINYPSFLKMDYLGKIYNQYVSDYGLHHELVQLENNKMLVLGANDDSDFLEAVLYIMDLNTGKIEGFIDMYEVLHDIDSEWIKQFGTNFDFVNNSAVYDEKTKDLLISVRGLNSIMMVNMETHEIKWIFGNPELYSEKFSKYLLKYDGRYPSGQHTAFYYNGLLGIHDNDYNMFDIKKTIGEYKNNYSSSDLYEINLENMSIKKVWTYDSNKQEFSKVAGAFKVLENENKLINYGWSINKNNKGSVLLNDENYLRGVIIELDKDDNVLFKATTKDLTYRVYKVELYEEKTENYSIESYKKVSDLNTPKPIKTSSIVNKLQNAKKFDGEINSYVNRIGITYEFNQDDEINLYLVSKSNKTYKYAYKSKDKDLPSSINTSINNGKYSIYLEVNNELFDTNKVIDFN